MTSSGNSGGGGTKSVTQFLRGLDLSGVNFGSVGEHVAAQSSDGVARRSKNRAIVSAALTVFPCTQPLEKMARLEWLKLRNSQLTNSDLPSELKYLSRLEYLSLAKNKLTRLTSITDWPKVFPNLRVLNCRKNHLATADAIPSDLFSCPNLQVVDFSCNQLTQVPKGIENASGLLVLNLSDNQLTSVPPEIFTECTELMLLDLSGNRLTLLPAQLRRCSSLQQLILNNNPFQHYQTRTIVAIKNLEVLHMSGTHRRLDNIPKELDRLTKLADLDLSHNQLVGIPGPIFDLRALRKLDLSHNEISELTALTDNWPSLEYLNLSHNQLCSLPAGLTRLTKLRKLYLNDNQLTFSGLPSGMAKLNDLEVLNVSNNKLENIPEGLCRCGRLKRLILSNNELETLPDAIHFLIENLEKFDVDNNPKLRFPPKPPALQKGAGLAFYNIDFSLDGQLQMMRGIKPEPSEDVKKGKESAARLKRMRRRRLDGGENTVEDLEGSGQVVLAGMRHIAGERDAIMRRRYAETAAADAEKQATAKRWKDALAKPNLDYSEIFDEDAGTQLGVEIWVIDEFYPKRFEPEDEEYVGQLFSGDCYIILQTREVTEVPRDGGATGNREWNVFYWIGTKASLDKRACVAMHAVNLRNFLGIDGQTQREEQGDESPEFLALFPGNKITILEGSSGSTGFHIVACKEAIVRMYRLFGQEKTMYIVSMPVSPASLDPKFVYLVDGDSCLYVWFGSKSRRLIQTRGRLLAEKIAQKERLNEATISLEHEGRESTEFWAVVMGLWKPAPRPPAVEHQEERPVQAIVDHPKPPRNVQKPSPARDYISVDWKLPKPILYDVKLGKGYLELLQVDLPFGQLTRGILNSDNVYLVDSGGELFVWMGKRSARFLRYAGFKLAEELTEMMPRGCFGGAEEILIDEIVADNSLEQIVTAHKRLPPQPCPEGAESEIFRAQFVGWEPAMAVDFTRTAQSVTERGADPNVILERDQIKTDLRALLAPRETPLAWDKAIQLMNDLNYELIEPLELDADFLQGSPTPSLQQFVILDRKWAPVDPQCEENIKNQDESPTDKTDNGGPNGASTLDQEEDMDEEEPTKTVVYFWQGREASELAWLTFNFSLRKDMEAKLSRNPNANGRPLSVEFKRVKQQQEDMYFLSHFLRKMVIHSGSYRDRDEPERRDAVQFYHLRMNGNPIATRCLQVKPTLQNLNSSFSYILRVPRSKANTDVDKVFVWIGKSAHPDDTKILQSICDQIYDPENTDVSMVPEGEEPEIFWQTLGGKGTYDQNADYLNYSRLFRLSNDAGYFHASEKCSDFCQDDLANDDVMMLDNGEQIYLWLGRKTSDVEVKLSLQAAKLYKEHMSRAQPSKPRQLKLTAKNAEPFMFRRCFHGWGPFYEPMDWSG
nr:protein flightless 1 [Hymenolepis microstoma]